jgi:hypothetical protein
MSTATTDLANFSHGSENMGNLIVSIENIVLMEKVL